MMAKGALPFLLYRRNLMKYHMDHSVGFVLHLTSEVTNCNRFQSRSEKLKPVVAFPSVAMN